MSVIAITGGAGFFGSHIVDALLEAGHEVLVCDNLSGGPRSWDNIDTAKGAIVSYEFDLSSPENQYRWQAALLKHEADLLIHAASPMSRDPLEYLKGMDLATGYLKTVEELHLPTLFISSSSAHIGEGSGYVGSSFQPEGLYGFTKIWTEYGLKELVDANATPATLVLRPSNLYGPREVFSTDQHTHVIPDLIRKVVNRELPITIQGDGTQTRPFTFVSDMVEAVMAGVDKLLDGSTGFVTTNIHGPQVAISAVLAEILKVEKIDGETEAKYEVSAPVKVSHRVLPEPDQDGWLDNWSHRTSLEEGIRQTVDWVKAHPERLT